MRFRILMVPLALLAAGGCGGGSSSTATGGGLSFRALWQQRDVAASAVAAPSGQVVHGSFGPTLPAAVRTIRILFDSGAGLQCCLAVNPNNLVSSGGSLVLDALPAGAATVTLAGFATDFAPVPASATTTCMTDPGSVGQPCDATQLATPSFESDPHAVTIVSGSETDAGDISVFAVPFVLSASPAPSSSGNSPVTFAYTLADAATSIDQRSVTLSVSQGGQPPAGVAVTLTACDDATSTPCSPCGQLAVKGVLVSSTPQTLASGSAQAVIGAIDLGSPPRALSFTYPFQVTGPTASEASAPIIVRPGGNIATVAMRAPAGSTIIVAPGVYGALAFAPGDLQGQITFLADITGTLTNSPAAAVVINARGRAPAVELSGQTGVTIDGFTLRGGTNAGVLVQHSNTITVQNCTIDSTAGDGVRLDAATNSLVFDDLIINNTGSGISISQGTTLRLFNNTVYNSGARGLLVADSCNVTVENNIFNKNTSPGMAVTATTGYSADFNLNTDGYAAGTPAGAHDVNADPLFISASREDFHLPRGLAGSTSPAVDAGDRATEVDLASALENRTTQTDGTPDTPPIDLGYHYPVSGPLPTPTP